MFVEYKKTRALIERIFNEYGFSADESCEIVDAFMAADLAGIESHGIQRMVRYDDAIARGMVDVKAVPEVVFETPLSAVIDAKKAMGQLVSCQAMRRAIEKAQTSGIGMVTVRNSNHFGIAGYYARMASKAGLIGMAMTNSEAIMVPTGSSQARLGTNPIALAFPADPVDFCFDAATTVVTRGKLEVYNKAEKDTPDGWILDSDGTPTNSPSKVIKNITAKAGGGILPLGGSEELTGGHKGYGYGMFCELFTSVLSGGPMSYQSYTVPNVADTAHFFMAINPALFGSAEEIRSTTSALLDDMRHSRLAEGSDRVYVHGEKEVEFAATVYEKGIPVNEKTIREIEAISKRLGIEIEGGKL